MKKIVLFAALFGAAAVSASAQMQITEWMYQGSNGEFVEFTNVGSSAINMNGWSYSDSGNVAGHVSLSAFGVVNPGESVILTETAAATFRSAWGLGASVDIIGGNLTDNLGRGDQINLYNNLNVNVDRLTFDDQSGFGPRTQNRSASIPLVDLGLTTASGSWTLATNGDSFGSHTSTGGDVGNPGIYTAIPEPSTYALAVGAAALAVCLWRRKQAVA